MFIPDRQVILKVMGEDADAFRRANPFRVMSALKEISPEITVKRSRSGALIIKSAIKQEVKRLLCLTELVGIKVKVVMPTGMNFSEGVIYAPELMEMTEAELVSELRSDGVVYVRRIKGALLHVRFNSTDRPQYLRAAYVRYRVREYLRPPRRCRNCCGTGHIEAECKEPARCGKCSGQHQSAQCTSGAIKCLSCGEDHYTWSFKCSQNRKPAETGGKTGSIPASTRTAKNEPKQHKERQLPVDEQPQPQPVQALQTKEHQRKKRRQPVKPSPPPAPAAKKPPVEPRPSLPLAPIIYSEKYKKMLEELRAEAELSDTEEDTSEGETRTGGEQHEPETVYSKRHGLCRSASYSDIVKRTCEAGF